MCRNILKIVENKHQRRIKYYYGDSESLIYEPLEWYSDLSQDDYTNVAFSKENELIIKKIVSIIDEIYNYHNIGLDILFVGEEDSFKELDNIVKKQLSDRDVRCIKISPIVMVMGKPGSGKTTIIQNIEKLLRRTYNIESKENINEYTDENHLRFIEIGGLNIGSNASIDLPSMITDKADLMAVYCIDSSSSTIESMEAKYISELSTSVPTIIAVTKSLSENDTRKLVYEIQQKTDVIVVPVLAENYDTQVGPKCSFGIDCLADGIYELI